MLAPFFAAAMRAPGRQLAFRREVVLHVALVAGLAWAAAVRPTPDRLTGIGYLLLVLGLVEGAALVGWRLTQMPKSQALEFLLTSPIQPRKLFLAEALVGIARFALVWLSGLPVLGGLVLVGVVGLDDFAPLAVMPLVWGVVAGLGLTAWVYEPAGVRRAGEFVGLVGVLLYLVVGVLAAENLARWLYELPTWAAQGLFDGVIFIRDWNPFGIVKFWFDPATTWWVAWERFATLHLAAVGLAVAFGARAAVRLRGHFHDRHYREKFKVKNEKCKMEENRDRGVFCNFSFFTFHSELSEDRPLSWWAVRRVMEYGGRVNLWLAGGFCMLYAAYLVAGDDWPAWMGRLVFELFEKWGGPPAVATAMAVMAAVPAVFQFGLWDPTAQDRCRRLELLLLTDLTARDYRHAARSAAWARGRGYLLAAGVLWLALGVSGRNTWPEVLAAAVGGGLVWLLFFAVGFRLFASAGQTNGVASVLTLGTPVILAGLTRAGWDWAVPFIPAGLCYAPTGLGLSWAWAMSAVGTAGFTLWLTRRGLARCDADLRRWYDANQGRKSVE